MEKIGNREFESGARRGINTGSCVVTLSFSKDVIAFTWDEKKSFGIPSPFLVIIVVSVLCGFLFVLPCLAIDFVP